jgi:Holliday junction resolvasome RuvABC endonuclease subunit
MPKKKQYRRKLRRGEAAKSTPFSSRLTELAEVQEILLPELAARIAAIEHLLMEKGLCSYNDLKQAREFIKIQEAS